MACVHGIDAPSIHTARVLEIGAGDAMNLMAFAVAHPESRSLGFDLAASAVQRGREWVVAAGISNIRIDQLDILDAAKGGLAGEWDYVIAHGVYAWVPSEVRKAVMRLIGQVLSPNGVAFISFNATPGGYLRLAMREMLLHHVGHIQDAAERIANAKHFLRDFAEDERSDEPISNAMRRLAAAMVDRPDGVLHHDELGENYEPQQLTEVVAAAAEEGLLWLGEAGAGRLMDGFGDEDQSPLVHQVQSQDFAEGRYFRQSLFVRAGARPGRSLEPALVAKLFASCRGRRTGEGEFTVDSATYEVSDSGLMDALDRLIAAWPARIACGDLFETPERINALFGMFDAGLVELHSMQPPFALEAGERPVASSLARLQIALDWPSVSTLDHRTLTISDPVARDFIAILDGSRDLDALQAHWSSSGHSASLTLQDALQALVRSALLQRPSGSGREPA
jgi:SAM-dependent methyltransferase